MYIFVEEINQVLSMRSGKLETRLTLSLPGGDIITAVVTDKDLSKLLLAQAGAGEQKEEKNPPQMEEPIVDEPEEQELYEDGEVEWASLPDEYLAPSMKSMLTQLGAAPVMPMSNLIALVNEIARTESLMEQVPEPEPYQGMMAQPATPPAPAPAQRATPRVGEVVIRRAAPRRTVPMTELGYPVVPGMEQDPGEVAVVDGDEDGIRQL